MNNLTQITDHSTAEARRLIDHFKGGNFEELVEGLGGRWQELENALWAIITGRYIANATGETLRNIGTDVGVDAVYTTDDAYRVLIYAKIAENRSTGARADVYNVLSLLQLEEIKVIDVYPASITVNYIPSPITLTCACIRMILESATLPIAMDITSHGDTGFGFMGDTSAYGFGAGELGSAG